MGSATARAWPVDWLPAYLATLGVTVLVDGSAASWTSDVVPVACIQVPGPADVAEAVAAALPSRAQLEELAIARAHPDSDVELPRGVSAHAFKARARLARSSADGSLEATITDLTAEPGKPLEHGPLDPPAPKGLTLHQRLVSIRATLPENVPSSLVADSMAGRIRRVDGNGLGFDVRRLDASVQAQTRTLVDPIVELLAFHGLLLHPVRGARGRVRQRGWAKGALARGSFSWPAWHPPLDRWAIDALLDRFYALRVSGDAAATRQRRAANLLGVHAAFASVSYQPKGSLDATRGIAAERLW